jgi:NADH:ubiquinone oxidoreductase subunit 6 (subunit J)
MDSPHAIGFYASSALALGAGLLVALLEDRARRALALAASGLGVAGVYTSLSAGFAAVLVLVSFAGCAVLVGRPDYRAFEEATEAAWRQLTAVAAALLFAGLAYAAYRGSFAQVTFNGGPFGAAAVGRLLLTHDALATEAVGALVLAALAGLTAAWRLRERGR